MEDLDPYFLFQEEYFHNLAAVQRTGTSCRLAAMISLCIVVSAVSIWLRDLEQENLEKITSLCSKHLEVSCVLPQRGSIWKGRGGTAC